MKNSLMRHVESEAMERLMMTWRSNRWRRWLGWTGLYAFVFWGGWVILDFVSSLAQKWGAPSAIDRAVVILGVLLAGSLVLVYRIGTQYPSRWWMLTPLVVIVLLTFLIPTAGQIYFG